MAKADPAHSVRLLWRAVEGPARGPKPGLDVDAVVAAAITIADADGLLKLSMRRVAESLGIATMSLYTYVPGKPDLLLLMQDEVMKEIVALPPLPAGWRPALERVAEDNRALFARHPWLLDLAAGRPPMGPGIFDKYERELRALDGIGLTDVEMDSVLSLVLRHVAGAVRLSTGAEQDRRDSGIDDMTWWAAVAPVLEAVVTTAYPVSSRVGEASSLAYEGVDAADRGLAFGLARILDGVEALIAGRAGGGAATS